MANVQLCNMKSAKSDKKNFTLILDFGNVLLDLNIEDNIRQMETLLGRSYDVYNHEMPEIFQLFEKGLCTEQEFYETLKELSFTQNFTFTALERAWNSLLGDVPDYKMMLLEQLKQKYRLVLLSNTNEIHLKGVRQSMGSEKMDYFESLFDKIYYSCRMGMRKPDAAIFQFILKDLKVQPNDLLFIDDGKMHIHGALQEGIPAILYTTGQDLGQLLHSNQIQW
jgi:HAD superfamily hydrolase (TIGR01509 family)